MKNILVVCIGNICRSPMAEGYFKRSLPNCNVTSAGLGAITGSRADPFAVTLMAAEDLDISRHVAQQISLSLVSQAEIIFVMDLEQKHYIETTYVHSRGKVFLLAEDANDGVPDPYRQGIEQFRIAQRLIDRGVQTWASRIAQLG